MGEDDPFEGSGVADGEGLFVGLADVVDDMDGGSVGEGDGDGDPAVHEERVVAAERSAGRGTWRQLDMRRPAENLSGGRGKVRHV